MHKEIEKRNSRSYVIPHQSLKSQYKRQGARSHFNFINYRCPGLSKHLRACRQPLNTLLLLPGEKRKRNTKKEKTRQDCRCRCCCSICKAAASSPRNFSSRGLRSRSVSELLRPDCLSFYSRDVTRDRSFRTSALRVQGKRERERERGHVFAGARLFNRMNNETRRKGNSLFGKF